ncbi:PREDICTED: Meckel syndrome type 1 protein-like [Dufourea novaeangliae]|uniref:Meckel syndrome type 1 protein n=1 Tax=Dufourea novaeangliae TaxID=178035 RepID=A0A154NZV2_DUFNO|nr:PREDICTED: Meckel syndrome type 1 protein-like [Dufourea novaeangliae]KZC04614.1 Meckel syndrome type 1 protein [Dufourea novaeangliae]
MSKKIRKTKVSANYRVKEPLNNFKLRVRIVQQRPLLAELLEDEGDTRDTNFLEEEDRILGWQEKAFSRFEANFYKESKNCITEAQKTYCQRINEENIEGSQLYSYTETDLYYPGNELLTKQYKTKLACRNETALPALQNRKPFPERYNKTVVDNAPDKTRIRTNHYVYMDRRTMYVMVDLSRRDRNLTNPEEDSETVLCVITYDQLHKILSVNPDFTDDHCYSITNSNGVEFNYWIEHASAKQTPEELQEKRNELQREIKERLVYKETEISHSFHLTPPHIHRIFIKLDILSAHKFIFNGLCISYYIDLPEHWNSDQKDHLFGRTQRCNLNNQTAYFGYATEISLDYEVDKASNVKKTLPSWPRLLLSVTSLDTWSRYRTEGYAAVSLPVLPGKYEFSIPTWRPTGSIINSLRRYFTGGTYELEDMTYCSIPVGHEDKVLNKSQIKITASGYIKLKLNIIYQTHTSIKPDDVLNYFENLSTGKLMINIENIFEQFKAARERMIQVRNLNV